MKNKNKYPTGFKTYGEFKKILGSIPAEDLLEWAKNLSPELLSVKDSGGWTIVHTLAGRGALPEEFVTKELLRMKADGNWTVAEGYCYFLSGHSRWDLLTPVILDVLHAEESSMIDTVRNNLAGMNDADLEAALSLMPGATRLKLLSDIGDTTLREKIRKYLDREAGNEAFEIHPGIKDSIFTDENDACSPPFGERENLYGAGRERQ